MLRGDKPCTLIHTYSTIIISLLYHVSHSFTNELPLQLPMMHHIRIVPSHVDELIDSSDGVVQLLVVTRIAATWLR